MHNSSRAVVEPSPKAAPEPEEEEEEEDGDESEALLGSNKSKKTPGISGISPPPSVRIVPSRDTVKVEGEPEKPTVTARVKKPYLNTDV